MSPTSQSYSVSVISRTGIGAMHIFSEPEEAVGAIEQALERDRVRTITLVVLDHSEARPEGWTP